MQRWPTICPATEQLHERIFAVVRERRRTPPVAWFALQLQTRVPEPELMDDAAQARAYSEADFDAPHQAFVNMFVQRFPSFAAQPFSAVDLGCGPADVTVRFAVAHPRSTIMGVDGSEPMLRFGRQRIAEAGLDDRVRLEQRHLPDADLSATPFDVVLSNSLLHHLSHPQTLWSTATACTARGGAVFVMDLCRPTDDRDVDRMVDTYAGSAPELLRHDFAASLRAAYRPDEVQKQLADAGLELVVEQPTDRHLLVWGSR